MTPTNLIWHRFNYFEFMTRRRFFTRRTRTVTAKFLPSPTPPINTREREHGERKQSLGALFDHGSEEISRKARTEKSQPRSPVRASTRPAGIEAGRVCESVRHFVIITYAL